ncbi:TPA: lysylphosphatidylglycerol synthase transmembrane domain-containing protein [Legionella anisa]|uniref:TIGR00374 family protein n=2 Tax=Legionella anisa TaxID=28082 RepID=A0AAX0WUP1_9GAMM|nr:UPF0104 family protein [Legionella anisa]PNL62143.1 TIGR00374 family protein [Legionella anisa]
MGKLMTKKKSHWLRHILGLLLTIICLGVIFKNVDLKGLKTALAQFHWGYLIPAVLSLLVGYSFRVLRWAIMLQSAGSKIKVRTCVAPFFGSFALNNVLPLRLGDAMRAFIFPSAIGVDKITATSSLLIERLIDLMTLLACLLISLLIIKDIKLPSWLVHSIVSLVILGGTTFIFLLLFSAKIAKIIMQSVSKNSGKETLLRKLLALFAKLLQDITLMSKSSVLLTLFGLSLLAWFFESGLYLFILMGFDLSKGLSLAVLIMAMVTLSTLLPSSPGYIGPFHLAAFTALTMLGDSTEQAASYAVLAHITLWLPITVIGGLVVLFTPELFRAVWRYSSKSNTGFN